MFLRNPNLQGHHRQFKDNFKISRTIHEIPGVSGSRMNPVKSMAGERVIDQKLSTVRLEYLLGPGSLDEVRVDHLVPSLLTLHVAAVREVLGDQLPALVELFHLLLQQLVLQHDTSDMIKPYTAPHLCLSLTQSQSDGRDKWWVGSRYQRFLAVGTGTENRERISVPVSPLSVFGTDFGSQCRIRFPVGSIDVGRSNKKMGVIF